MSETRETCPICGSTVTHHNAEEGTGYMSPVFRWRDVKKELPAFDRHVLTLSFATSIQMAQYKEQWDGYGIPAWITNDEEIRPHHWSYVPTEIEKGDEDSNG